jgi:hypothetical protein
VAKGVEVESVEMEPAFSRLAAVVMRSPYFHGDAPDEGDADAADAYRDRLRAERNALQKGLKGCRDEGDLRGEAAKIYQRAKASLPRAKGG